MAARTRIEIAVVFEYPERLPDALGGIADSHGVFPLERALRIGRENSLDGSFGEDLHGDVVGVVVQRLAQARLVVHEVAMSRRTEKSGAIGFLDVGRG